MTKDTINKDDITALVLAGGRALRMQGRDKGLLPLRGRPLVEHCLERFRHQVGTIVISANRNAETYARYGYPVLADEFGENRGPLAGILTALRFVSTPYVLVLPCDCPCLPADLCQRMAATLAVQGGTIAIAHDGKRAQFTVALVPRALAGDLQHYLEAGGRKVETWLRQHELVEVGFEDQPEAFVNINTETDLVALEKREPC